MHINIVLMIAHEPKIPKKAATLLTLSCYQGTCTFIPKKPETVEKGRNETVIIVRAFII